MTLKGSTLTLTSGDGARIDCYHVVPEGERKGGLVLIMEIFGVTEHIKEMCDRFAEDGYEVLSPALYDRQQKNYQAGYAPEDIQRSLEMRAANPYDNTVLDVQMCIDALKDKGPVFVTGYCYGGTVAWLAACRCHDLTAAAGYYGGAIKDFIDEQPKCPIILHFGEHDHSIPMTNVAAIRQAHPDVPVYIYDAGHGFNSDRRADYNEAAAELARKRTLDHFAAQAGQAARTG